MRGAWWHGCPVGRHVNAALGVHTINNDANPTARAGGQCYTAPREGRQTGTTEKMGGEGPSGGKRM